MTDSLKILIFDIETLPNIQIEWTAMPDYPISNHNKILKEKAVLCVGWKWLGEKKTYSASLLDDLETFARDPYQDRGLLEKFKEALDQADIVVAHNGAKFDVPWLNGRFLKHGLGAFPVVRLYDTCKVSRAAFNLNFNSLDYLAKYLGIPGKTKTSFDNWLNIVTKSSVPDLKHLVRYCEKGDVPLLEKVYLRLRPYSKAWRPTTGLTRTHEEKCDACGSDRTIKWGRYQGPSRSYQKYKCNDCGRVFAGTKALKTDEVEAHAH